MNSFVRIGGALALGTLIVLWSFSARSTTIAESSNESAVIVKASERTYIPPTDSDGDGVSDWEQAFTEAGTFDTVEIPTEKAVEEYVPPETFTGKFSEALFTNFVKSEIHGDELYSKDTLINNALVAIDGATQSKQYTRASITTTSDSLPAARDYGNQVADIIVKNSSNLPETNEAQLLAQALETNDEATLTQIKASQEAYSSMIRDISALAVPQSITSEHLALLNTLQIIHDDIAAMTVAFEDPLQTLARVGKYQNNVIALTESFRNIGNALVAQGITYSDDEPGVMFYLFTM